jgi:hypothetical protein
LPTSTALLVIIGTLIAVVGVLALGGLAVSARLGLGVAQPRGRASALVGLGAVGVLAGLTGALFQGYTVRVGGWSGSDVLDAGGTAQAAHGAPSPVSASAAASASAAGGGAGFDFPLGALIMLAVLAGLLFAGARLLRAPIGVAVPTCCWLAVVAVLMYGGGGKGDVILAASAPAQVYLYGGLILALGFLVLVYQWQLTDRFSNR